MAIKPDDPNKPIYEQVLSNMGVGGGGSGSGEPKGVYQIMVGNKVVATAQTESGAIAIMKSYPGAYIYPKGF